MDGGKVSVYTDSPPGFQRLVTKASIQSGIVQYHCSPAVDKIRSAFEAYNLPLLRGSLLL